MNNTGTDKLSQVCDSMLAALRWNASLVVENFDLLPEAQRYEICRLGSAMWAQVQSIQMAADPNFQAFKVGLLAKPKRARKPGKVTA